MAHAGDLHRSEGNKSKCQKVKINWHCIKCRVNLRARSNFLEGDDDGNNVQCLRMGLGLTKQREGIK
jgi:hypothetical protein